jgi:hypothetical protein
LEKTMLRPPEHFGRAARKEFRRIVTELEGAGINPATRVALIVATLEADGNIARLQADLARARGNSRVQLTWAVDRAITERRKTAEALWRGQARRVYRPPEPAEGAARDAEIAARDE